MTMTIRSTLPRSTGRITDAVDRDAAGERDARAWRRTPASSATPWCAMSAHAMYVDSVAISPCAKLMTPVERWMITSASASSA